MEINDELPSWEQLFPEGRVIYCEEDGDSAIYAFVEAVKEEFGFDPSADPLWDWQALSGPKFRCPPQHLDAIYGSGRWRMGS